MIVIKKNERDLLRLMKNQKMKIRNLKIYHSKDKDFVKYLKSYKSMFRQNFITCIVENDITPTCIKSIDEIKLWARIFRREKSQLH